MAASGLIALGAPGWLVTVGGGLLGLSFYAALDFAITRWLREAQP